MDDPTRIFQTEGAGSTVVHPVGLATLIICGCLLMILPRKYALWPFILMICLIPNRQCIAIFGLNLYFSRFMVLFFGALRAVFKGEYRAVRWNALDVAVIGYGLAYLFTGTLAWNFSVAEFKTRAGYITDAVGIYILMRMLIRDFDDVRVAIKGLAIILIPLVAFFLLEHTTARNIFSVFGGVPALTHERGGRLRCQGAFGHAILAGTFWASLLPLLMSGITSRKNQMIMLAGTAGALAIVVLSASSTPVLGVAFAVAGMCVYRWRSLFPYAVWSVAICAVVLHLVMKAPVWALVQRINITEGNSGYHRYLLIDGLIRNAHEWWLLGSTTGTAHWGHFTFDTANHFVTAGVSGGILTLGLFITCIVLSVRYAVRRASLGTKRDQLLAWSIAVAIGVHTLCFIGISIWGQLHFSWNMLLAFAACATPPIKKLASETVALPAKRREASPAMLMPSPAGAGAMADT